jgi:hypothetical protein
MNEILNEESVVVDAKRRAIRAAISCLLWHGSLVGAAQAVETDSESPEIPAALKRVWEAATKEVYQFFSHGDVIESMERQQELDSSPNMLMRAPSISRSTSVNRTAGEKAVVEASSRLCARATFLLDFTVTPRRVGLGNLIARSRWQLAKTIVSEQIQATDPAGDNWTDPGAGGNWTRALRGVARNKTEQNVLSLLLFRDALDQRRYDSPWQIDRHKGLPNTFDPNLL